MHMSGHWPVHPSSVHPAFTQQTLGHNSSPGCVVCTWEVGSKEEISGGLHMHGLWAIWQGIPVASVVRRRGCGFI
jgi:hypothetical protein